MAESQNFLPVTNPLDTLFDLLNRDQRTILTINRESRCESWKKPRKVKTDLRFGRWKNSSRSFEISNSNSVDGFNRKIKSRSRGPRRKFSHLTGLVQRLGEVFVVGVCLLTIIRVPAVMSAPSTRHAKATEKIHSHEPTEGAPNYMHPCGVSHEEMMKNSNHKMTLNESNPLEIMNKIIIRTANALAFAESFRDRYVWETFDLSFEVHHSHWVNQSHEWLPNENEIPKRLGKQVSSIHLNSLSKIHLKNKTFDDFLVKIYKYLQKFAVALEQVVADQKSMQGKFHENFLKLDGHLVNVLCEVKEGIMERNVAPPEVPRSIMKEEVRHLEQASFRNIRDWLIFRDLMNGLEYVIQVFTFIERNLRESSVVASS